MQTDGYVKTVCDPNIFQVSAVDLREKEVIRFLSGTSYNRAVWKRSLSCFSIFFC